MLCHGTLPLLLNLFFVGPQFIYLSYYCMLAKPQTTNNENRPSTCVQGPIGTTCTECDVFNDSLSHAGTNTGGNT